jgi:hypothetical protein
MKQSRLRRNMVRAVALSVLGAGLAIAAVSTAGANVDEYVWLSPSFAHKHVSTSTAPGATTQTPTYTTLEYVWL